MNFTATVSYVKNGKVIPTHSSTNIANRFLSLWWKSSGSDSSLSNIGTSCLAAPVSVLKSAGTDGLHSEGQDLLSENDSCFTRKHIRKKNAILLRMSRASLLERWLLWVRCSWTTKKSFFTGGLGLVIIYWGSNDNNNKKWEVKGKGSSDLLTYFFFFLVLEWYRVYPCISLNSSWLTSLILSLLLSSLQLLSLPLFRLGRLHRSLKF